MSIYIKPGLRIFQADVARLRVEARNDVPCEITCVMPDGDPASPSDARE